MKKTDLKQYKADRNEALKEKMRDNKRAIKYNHKQVKKEGVDFNKI